MLPACSESCVASSLLRMWQRLNVHCGCWNLNVVGLGSGSWVLLESRVKVVSFFRGGEALVSGVMQVVVSPVVGVILALWLLFWLWGIFFWSFCLFIFCLFRTSRWIMWTEWTSGPIVYSTSVQWLPSKASTHQASNRRIFRRVNPSPAAISPKRLGRQQASFNLGRKWIY